MLFANLIDGREFRFRQGGDPTTYVKVGPNHYRKASAGIHACCLPISAHDEGEFAEIDEVKPTPQFTTPIPRATRPGEISNAIITRRNGGVRHQFIDDIGGCSANYR